MNPFASLEDMRRLWRPMTPEEQEKAVALLPVVSDILREEALRCGVNLDRQRMQRQSFASVLKSVTVDVTARALQTPTEGAPMQQTSQSALGYTVSGTYLVPGGGVFIKKSELARLGLRRPQLGVIEVYGQLNPRNPGLPPHC